MNNYHLRLHHHRSKRRNRMTVIMTPPSIWSPRAPLVVLKHACAVVRMLTMANRALHRLYVLVSAECTRLGLSVV